MGGEELNAKEAYQSLFQDHMNNNVAGTGDWAIKYDN